MLSLSMTLGGLGPGTCAPVASAIDLSASQTYRAASDFNPFSLAYLPMKVRSSLKSLKNRHRDCKLVRRKGVVYVINKTDPRFKAKQG